MTTPDAHVIKNEADIEKTNDSGLIEERDDMDEDTIRLISGRKANAEERRKYREANP